MKQRRPAATDDGMNDDAILVDEPELIERSRELGGSDEDAQARQVGQAWGADLIFWGQASCSRRDPLSCKLSPVIEKGTQVKVQVQGNVRAANGNVRIGVNDNRRVTVAAPPPNGMFKTSVTLSCTMPLGTSPRR